MLQPHDSFHNPLSSGGNSFTVHIAGVSKDSITVSDHNDGTYAVQYIIPAEGSTVLAYSTESVSAAGT